MTCEEFELALPDVEGSQGTEQQSHLNSCSACSDLVADLDAISREAKFLQSTDDPHPRVWNSIAIALKQEGLIREPKPLPFLVPRRPPRGRLAWLIPVGVMLLLMVGVVQYARSPRSAVSHIPDGSIGSTQVAFSNIAADRNFTADQQLLQAVAERTPAMRSLYEANLRDVNSYIRDAEESVRTDPNDSQAQLDLMNAYEQRSMVYEMALDHSLP